MATQREIKRRIKSAKNIGQVTSALEMISAVKMRKAQAAAHQSQPYTEVLMNVMNELGSRQQDMENGLLRRPEKIENALLLIVATQKGLVGSMLTNLAKETIKYVDNNKDLHIKAVCWGKKARSIAAKAGLEVAADFSEDKLPLEERISAVTTLLMQEFLGKKADVVMIAGAQFINTMTQIPRVIQYLPLSSIETNSKKAAGSNSLFKFEPSPEKVLDMVLKRYVEQVMNQTILDSLAAEHSARMIAMKNAHDNATDITKELTLLYNKTRQTSITNEIADISAASVTN